MQFYSILYLLYIYHMYFFCFLSGRPMLIELTGDSMASPGSGRGASGGNEYTR